MKKHFIKIKTQRQLIVLSLASFALFSILILSSMSSGRATPTGQQRLVTIYDQGAERAILTYADTVRGALKEAQVDVSVYDATDPVVDSLLAGSQTDIIIYRSRPVVVIDGSVRQTVMTVAQSPSEILDEAKLQPLISEDKATLEKGSGATRGANILVVERAEIKPVEPEKPVFIPHPNALTKSKGAHVFVDSSGVAHRETYYDLPMNIVIGLCGPGASYSVRSEDGAKVDQDGYVLVAAGFAAYPRCSIVETSLGLGKVYDTGGFALRHPYGFDLATDWTNSNGQ